MIEERHFASIDDVITHCEKELNGSELRNLLPLHGITHLWTSDGTLIPYFSESFTSPHLYRGQICRHRPCLPGVFRGMPLVDHPHSLPPAAWVRCLVDRIKLEEFVGALDGHPASAYAREIGLRTYPCGLAQHYELSTDRMDLTEDHRVAAFFATNTHHSGAWTPVRDGVGVLYRLHRRSFFEHFGERLEWLGKQVLPRPNEQRACTLVMGLGLDFETLPIEVFTFQQVADCGERLNAHFDGGAALFPPDVMAELALTIRSDTTLPRSVLESLMREGVPADDLTDEAERSAALIATHSRFRVIDREPHSLSARQHQEATKAVDCMKETFLHGVGVMAVRKVAKTTSSTGDDGSQQEANSTARPPV